MQIPLEQIIRVMLRQARAQKVAIAITFGIISIVALAVGANWPNRYMSETTLYADEKNIIGPLLKGSAEMSKITDHAGYAREIIFSRVIMDKVLEAGGWLDAGPSAVEKEQIIKGIEERTRVANIGKGLIRVAYTDSESERAFKVTLKFAELFVADSAASKKKESQEAYGFVSSQVDEYHEKLQSAEKRLKKFRSTDLDTRPDVQNEVYDNISDMQMRMEEAETELKEELIRRASLQKQLTGETESVIFAAEVREYNEQIVQLQETLRNLRLNYHDSYPDIIRVKQQIDGIKKNIEEERSIRNRRAHLSPRDSDVSGNNDSSHGTLFDELRSELASSRTTVQTLQARIIGLKQRLEGQVERAKRIHDREAELAELTRDYEVNQKIYQDLLLRREAARVSMHLDMEGQGLKFRLQEPANLPLVPTGLSFKHFFFAGPMLGLIFPLGILFVYIRFDPRVRFDALITEKMNLPVLASVPHTRLVNERPHKEYVFIAGIVVSIGVIYLLALWARLNGFTIIAAGT